MWSMVRFLASAWAVILISAEWCICDHHAGHSSKNDNSKSAMDKIFEINDINRNGQSKSTFSAGGGAREDPDLFEGDIIRTPQLTRQVNDMKAAAKTGAAPFEALTLGKWPGGNIPYKFASGFTGKNIVMQAIEEFRKHTCINWVPRKSEDNYVYIYNGNGCFSMIGRYVGAQQLSLGYRCLQKGIAMHEMMHAAGFFHEQSRLDRDTYIEVRWGNIPSQMEYNFEKYRPGEASTLNEPYDKQSLMHYGNYAFSTNRRKTIVSRSNPDEKLGQREGFSPIDIKQLNKFYNCKIVKPITKKPTVPPENINCRDSSRLCVFIDKKSHCRISWVPQLCKRSCGKCPGGTSSCRNNKSDWACLGWSQKGYCKTRFVQFMKDHCAKACNYC